jgi:hypothetical protein
MGDMLVAAAVIAYLGAFTAPWRARLVKAALGTCSAQVAGAGRDPTGQHRPKLRSRRFVLTAPQ